MTSGVPVYFLCYPKAEMIHTHKMNNVPKHCPFHAAYFQLTLTVDDAVANVVGDTPSLFCRCHDAMVNVQAKYLRKQSKNQALHEDFCHERSNDSQLWGIRLLCTTFKFSKFRG